MKYCVPYDRNFHYLNEIDEVIVPFNDSLDFFKRLIDKKRIHHSRIILDIEDSMVFHEDWKTYYPVLKELKEKHEINYALRFDVYSDLFLDFYEELKLLDIQFFFKTFVRDWDVFHGFIKLGVSDLYIVESLAFELNLLGPAAHAKGISIRVFANVCQNSWSGGDSLKSFFIRPEDVEIYAPYVDIIELFEGNVNLSILYKIYAKDKKWFGDLQDIITGLNQPLDSRRVLPFFAEMRVKCGKKCMKGNPCKICERIVSAAKTLEENNFILKRKPKFDFLDVKDEDDEEEIDF